MNKWVFPLCSGTPYMCAHRGHRFVLPTDATVFVVLLLFLGSRPLLEKPTQQFVRPQLAAKHAQPRTHRPVHPDGRGRKSDQQEKTMQKHKHGQTYRCHAGTLLQSYTNPRAHHTYIGKNPPVRTIRNTTVNTGLSTRNTLSATCAQAAPWCANHAACTHYEQHKLP